MNYHMFIIFQKLDCIRGHDLNCLQDKEYSVLNIENNKFEFITDFNYNEFSLVDMKLPFINCNRNIMVGQRTDFVDMFILGNTYLADIFLMNIDETLSRTQSILSILNNVLNSEYYIKKESIHSEKIPIEPDVLYKNMELVKNMLKRTNLLPSIHDKNIKCEKDVQYLFHCIDEYIFADLGVDIYLIELKPSEILRTLIDDESQNLVESNTLLFELFYIYDIILENLKWLKEAISKFNSQGFLIHTEIPQTLGINILSKWIN